MAASRSSLDCTVFLFFLLFSVDGVFSFLLFPSGVLSYMIFSVGVSVRVYKKNMIKEKVNLDHGQDQDRGQC